MGIVLRPLREWEARRALRTAREAADAELLASRLPSPRLAWRTQELTSDENRLRLARSVAEIVHAADERLLPSASPLDRGGVRECRAILLELASRLYDLNRSVRPRGMLLADRLQAGAGSPLFGRHGPTAIRRAAGEVLRALDGEERDGAGA